MGEWRVREEGGGGGEEGVGREGGWTPLVRFHITT